MHLIEKTPDGTRIRHRWDDAQTPFARLLATNTLEPAKRERLERLYAETSHRALRRTIQNGLRALLYPRPIVLAPPTTPTEEAAPAQVASY